MTLGDHANVAAAFVDTDGSDGGTDVAGAVIDGEPVARAAGAGVDVEASLEAHRSREALARLDDLVVTGPTVTNVNDLFVLAVGEGETQ